MLIHSAATIRRSRPSAAGGGGAWQLTAGNYVPQKLTGVIIQPRPDGERSTNSRYSYAYPGIEFEVPIVVLGMAYPLRYQITSKTGTASVSNATIGETRTYNVGREWYGSANQQNYGILRWTPDAGDDGNTYSFTVLVTGQDGNTASVSFSGTVSVSKFVFVQDTATGGDGSIGSPFEDTDDVWGPDAAFSTYAGKFVYLMAGNYSAMPTSNWTTNKPLVWMRYPGDARPVFDGSAKDYTFDNTGCDDFWWSGIYINSSPGVAVSNCRFFEATTSTSDFDRAMFWDNYFYDGNVGSVGTDNNAWIVHMDNGTISHKYNAIVGNTFDDANSASNGFNCCTFFNSSYFVIEHNIVKNYSGETTFQPKDDTSYWSIRSNDLWENNNNGTNKRLLYIRNQITDSPTLVCGYQEVCWNFCKGGFIDWNSEKSNTEPQPFYAYRNSIYVPTDKAGIKLATFNATTPGETIELIKNFIAAQDDPLIAAQLDPFGSTDAAMGAWWTNGTFDNIYYDSDATTNINATTGVLQNDGLSVLGTYGAEISN